MKPKNTAVHVTHEAVGKIGGIGAVLEGLLNSEPYQREIDRNILVSPLFSIDGDVTTRLGPEGEVLYSSIDGLVNSSYFKCFRRIENLHNVNIVYGRKTVRDSVTGQKSSAEIILVDISHAEQGPINEFKARLFQEFGIRSNLYEHLWEFEQYVRLAVPALACIQAIAPTNKQNNTIVIAHEFMGMPTALAAKLDQSNDFRTIFYAHEVAPVRQIVEKHPGHDTMFYNVMAQAQKRDLSVADVFGDQSHFFKAALVEAARHCDAILAVGDCVVDELKFLAPEFKLAEIDLTYNGIPFCEISLAEKLQSRELLREYCQNILGYKPDFVFTHVTRLVVSKGLWRDLRVLGHLDKEFASQNRTAVLLVLSTEVGPRSSRDIRQMERDYNWPVAHREGLPDLSGGEAAFYAGVQEFNARSRNIKVVYINQFGFTQQTCGHRMPRDVKFADIRMGSDVEFGQSIYEPFGIAQLEPLAFGGICVVTDICGCAGFAKRVANTENPKNVIFADYTQLNDYSWSDVEDLLRIDRDVRHRVEEKVSGDIARELCARLPHNENEMYSLLSTGYEIARHMGWDAVAEKYVLKGIHKALSPKGPRTIRIRA